MRLAISDGMLKRIAQATAFVLAMQILPAAANIAGPFTLLIDRGFGWQPAGEFDRLRECEMEAAYSAMVYRARTGCTTARAFERWQNGITFERVALSCATASGARIVVAPGERVNVFGTEQAALEFDGCMRAWSGVVRNRR
jgi:hypothetical protein